MSKTIIKIRPADHGRPMDLDDFVEAEAEEGRLYELGRGIIYNEKPEEYLRAGVKEYWIVDSERRALIVMRRSRGRWTETQVSPPAVYRTRLLPGLAFSIESVFTSARLA